VLWTGNGTSQSIDVGFQPDFVWHKTRSTVNNHILLDVIRGEDQVLYSNLTNSEASRANSISLTSTGFDLEDNWNTRNGSGITYVAWNWKANGSGVSNTDGSITSTVSANTDAGFSIITYTGDGGTTSTIGHGLSQAPDIAIFKCRSNGSTGWIVNSPSILGTGQNLILNTTAAKSYSASSDFVYGASTIQLDYGDWANGSGRTYVAYAFHSVDGFSKFGNYTGNGSTDGPFVYTGFRPAFLLYKDADANDVWTMIDNRRDPANDNGPNQLSPNSSAAETIRPSGVHVIDFVSNGFKIRYAGDTAINQSGHNFIYMAFAENPFKYANAR